MLSEYFFLVADASAASSAEKTMSFGTFFSRASASTSSSTSLPFMTLSPLDPRHQAGLVDVRQRNRVRSLGRLEAQHARVDAAQHAFDPARIADRLAQLELRLLAAEPHVVGLLLERSVEPGRRNLEPRVRDRLDREQVRQMVAHACAVLDVHAAGLVDEDA